MSNDKLLEELLSLNPSAIITLYEVDLTNLPEGDIHRFHNGTNELLSSIIWNGNTYNAHPIQIEGFDRSGQGVIPRPTMTISNILGFMSGLMKRNNDLLGAKVTRIKTFAKHLDAANFVSGNTEADPTVEFPRDVYYVDRKSSETHIFVEFELSASWDVQGVKLPRRIIAQNTCPWIYKGDECSYVPGDMFDTYDLPTTSSNEDLCGKKLNSCRLRFGEGQPLPFGGFPGAGLLR